MNAIEFNQVTLTYGGRRVLSDVSFSIPQGAFIGLLGAKVATGTEGDQVEGYHLHVSGGFGADAAIALLLYSDVTADDVPRRIEGLLRAYLAHRADPTETFAAFTRRQDADGLKVLAERALA